MTLPPLSPASAPAPEVAAFATTAPPTQRVTARALAIGLLLSPLLAALNCWLETQFNVHFLGGVGLPLGAVFGLLFLILVINGPLKYLKTRVGLSAAELLTVYAMLLFAALVSTPGADNFFLTTGPGLFYFATKENGWADTFYRFVPSHFAPGWDGVAPRMKLVNDLYLGNVPFSKIPWHLWMATLIAWCTLLLLVYSALFFFALLLRRQWIENEALAFPLVQLPLQMVDASPGDSPPARQFWGNPMMWGGVGLAVSLHFLRGMNGFFPVWPAMGAFQGSPLRLSLPERPWSAAGTTSIEFFLGAIGIAYLLTSEVSLSFWVFFFWTKVQMIVADRLGFQAGGLTLDPYTGQPAFLACQSIGGWAMMAALLLWSARGHFRLFWDTARRGQSREGEPFSPRAVLIGFALSLAGIGFWSWFSGLNLGATAVFFTIYLLTSLVLARLVVEGGFLFPQQPFGFLPMMSTSYLPFNPLDAAQITRFSFVQPVLALDMRTNLLPGFLHTLKIAHQLNLEARSTRRLLAGVCMATVVSLLVTCVVSLATLYKSGGLAAYSWFSIVGPQSTFNSAGRLMTAAPDNVAGNWLWTIVGAAVVWGMMIARARFSWFAFHPLGFLVATGYPIGRLWPSFFMGWLVKTLVIKYGGNDVAIKLRPFMIGLILGNAVSMVFWMLIGFWLGSQIGYWPA